MGTYDNLNIKCPSCGELNSIQCKAYLNQFKKYDETNAPLEVLMDAANKKLICTSCKEPFKITIEYQFKAAHYGDEGNVWKCYT